MGVILDSSIVNSAERHGDTVAQLLRNIATLAGDQEVALSAIGLMELIHGILSRRHTAEAQGARAVY